MSGFWSIWISVITLGSLAFFTWLLLANRSRPADGQATTGHESDGIEEYDNPLPFWWLLMFLITLVFAFGYLLVYPGLGNNKGLFGWTQIDQWQTQVDRAAERYGQIFANYAQTPIEELARDSKALRMGQRIFANNCAQCHGLDARGSFGFPNLGDGEWLWGGTPEQIKYSISMGRNGVMPPLGQSLGEDGVNNVALYVQNLAGIIDSSEQTLAGKAQFDAMCASCHGSDGTGNTTFGAPNLTNDSWLYGGELEQIKHTIRNGRSNVMPAQEGVLNANKIHLLTAYVYSLNKRG